MFYFLIFTKKTVRNIKCFNNVLYKLKASWGKLAFEHLEEPTTFLLFIISYNKPRKYLISDFQKVVLFAKNHLPSGGLKAGMC